MVGLDVRIAVCDGVLPGLLRIENPGPFLGTLPPATWRITLRRDCMGDRRLEIFPVMKPATNPIRNGTRQDGKKVE